MKEMEANNEEHTIPRRRALGKGLEELFNSEVLDYSAVEKQIVDETPKDEVVNIKLSELRTNPYQPRKVFDEEALEELASSIKEYGVFQPIIAYDPRSRGAEAYINLAKEVINRNGK